MIDVGESEDVMPPEKSEAVRLFDEGYRAMRIDLYVDEGVERYYVLFHAKSEYVDIVVKRADCSFDWYRDACVPIALDALDRLDWVLHLLDTLTSSYCTGLGVYTA